MVYLVLELGGGRTLEAERKLAGGKVPLGRALSWLQQLGAVLAYLHAQTPPIIHRDLKPENVLLDEIGRIMLIDFGIAKQAADGAQTRALARAATHGFSPPEQAMGTGTDPRSDVYALAATFYALVTGTVPTPAHERVAGTELADPTSLVPELPASMAGALLQALSLNLNRRPASIEAFLHAMGLMATPAEEAAATSRTVLVSDLGSGRETGAASVRIRSERLTVTPVAPPPRRRSGAGIWTAVGVLALAAGAGGFWFLQQQEVPAPTAAHPATPPPVTSVTSAPPAAEPVAAPAAESPAPQVTGAPPPAVATDAPPPVPVPGPPPAQEAAPRVPDALVVPAGLAAGAGSPTPDAATPPLPAVLAEPPASLPPDVVDTATTVAPATAAAVPVAAATAPVAPALPEPPASLPPRPRAEPAPEAASSSAMDAFEKRRTRPATEQPEVVVSAPADADKPVQSQPKPRPKPKPTTQSEGSSGWSGVYMGGSRRE
jgi:serine/threonine-protein kinase